MTIREGPSYPGPERKPTMEVSLCPYFFFNCLNRQKKLAPWTDNSGNQYEIVQSENNNALSCVRMAPCRPGAFLFSSAFFGPIWPEAWRNTKGGTLYRVTSFRVSPQDKKETGHHVILYEESCFIPASNEPSRHACKHIWRMPRGSKTLLLAAGFLIDRISLTFHTIV